MTNKLDKLKNILKEMESVLIAYSGGLDSSFLLKVAQDVLGERTCAVTAVSPMYVYQEIEDAKNFCEKYSIDQLLIESKALDISQVKTNAKDRCYHCKKYIFSKCLDLAKELKFKYVADGSNKSDLGDYRPGAKAGEELKIRKPLLEAGFTKEDIRKYSKELGLETWDKPSMACLASRIDYGVELTEDKLQKIDDLESFIRDLGISQVRVRDHEKVARIEVLGDDISKILDEELREKIINKATDLGYIYVALDLKGYRTGSMNEA